MVNERDLKAIIFDIQAFSIHDGPGCRTTIFFAGCPLRCKWCANPENFAGKRHLMFAPRVCKWHTGCRACVDLCPRGGLHFEDTGPVVHWEICNRCETFECTQYCASESLKICGKIYTIDDIIKILKRDCSNWGSEGGVTFSGGEPCLHDEFLLALLKRCKSMHIHTAIETAGNIPTEKFLTLMAYIDFAFIDIKNMDDEKHREGTGVSNALILQNIAALKASGWPGRLVLRQPTIHDYNDSVENAQKVIAFMQAHDLYEINLLKFHRLGQTKWEQLGMEYAYVTGGDMAEDTMQELQALYLNNEILCYLGDKTPF